MCDFCCEDGKVVSGKEYNIFGRDMTVDLMLTTYKQKNILEAVAENETVTEMRIAYCPMCGRKLND